jgi:hypothetical protein
MKARWLVLSALLLMAGCLLIPDDQEKGTRVANTRPSVSITAGAATSDSSGTDYKVNFQWRGSDDDGVVLRFEYAVDDTTSERAWQDTTGFSTLLKFRATHPNQQGADGSFNDWHTFYIRAIDNEYAISTVDERYFNATTIAPSTRITSPRFPPGVPSTVKTFVLEWEGEDLDSSNPERKPAFYEIKMIRIPNPFIDDALIVDSLRVLQNTFLDTLEAGDRTRWVRISGELTTRTLRDLPDTQESESFVFAIRAVDEAGAVEPVLERSDNWIVFHVQDRPAKPDVTVIERSIGRRNFPAPTPPIWEIEVPTNTPIRFQWTGDASSYGSKAGNVNYGLDIPDPADERYRDPRGIGGWIGWGKYTQVVTPLVFADSEDGQTHLFYLRMRDVSDAPSSEILCTIAMKVVAFTFERTALLVDDARVTYGLQTAQQDVIHDAYVKRFIRRIYDFAPQGIDEVALYRATNSNPEGRNPTQNDIIPLDRLARYGTILWNFNFTTGSASGLWLHEHEEGPNNAFPPKRLLSSYIGAGGKFFLFGGRGLSTTISLLNGGPAGGDFPFLPPQAGPSDQDFGDDSFIWKFLHVRQQIVGIDGFNCYSQAPYEHQQWRDGLMQCVSTNPAYPDLMIDPSRYNADAPEDCGGADIHPPKGGIKDYEGIIFDRNYAPFFAEAGLDTLYTSRCYNWDGSPPTKWNDAVIAQRYESTHADTLAGTQQGRVMLFLFQPYPFFEGPAIDAGTAAINWLLTGQDF